MMPGPDELKAALQRLIDGNASEADRDAVRMALNTGVLVTGERAVAVGGNASDVIITTGRSKIPTWRKSARNLPSGASKETRETHFWGHSTLVAFDS